MPRHPRAFKTYTDVLSQIFGRLILCALTKILEGRFNHMYMRVQLFRLFFLKNDIVFHCTKWHRGTSSEPAAVFIKMSTLFFAERFLT